MKITFWLSLMAVVACPWQVNAHSDCCDHGAPAESSHTHDDHDHDHGGEGVIEIDPRVATSLGLETVAMKWDRLQPSVSALGVVEMLPEGEGVISSRVAGRILEIHVAEGALVEKGQVVMTLEGRQAGFPPPQIELVSPISGQLAELAVRVGHPIEPDHLLGVVRDFSKLQLRLEVPVRYLSALREGASGQVEFMAYRGQTFEAKFSRLASKSENAGHTVTAYFHMEREHEQIRPGMRVRLALSYGESEEEGWLIPSEALQGDFGRHHVYIAEDAASRTRFTTIPVAVKGRAGGMVMVDAHFHTGDEVLTRGGYALRYAAGEGQAQLSDMACGHDHGHSHEAEAAESHNHDEGHEHGDYGYLVYALGGSTGLLFLLVILQTLWMRRRSGPVAKEESKP